MYERIVVYTREFLTLKHVIIEKFSFYNFLFLVYFMSQNKKINYF